MNFISHLSHGLSLTYWRTLLNALRNEFKVDLQVIMKFSQITDSGDAADVSTEISFSQNWQILAKWLYFNTETPALLRMSGFRLF